MRFEVLGGPLRGVELPIPEPSPDQVLVRVRTCGICRTDLHLVDGELSDPTLPIVPGHQIVGTVELVGAEVSRFAVGDRVGVPWLGWTCGRCDACRNGQENLCPEARFTGCHLDGGYAEYTVADQRYSFPIPEQFPDLEAAPLLCAGLIGFRALRMAGAARRPGGGGQRVGFYGFGSAAHILAQVVRHEGRRLFAFTRPGDAAGQSFARDLGAEWAGGSDDTPPEPLDAAILFAPEGALLPAALAAVAPGGVVVCAGIHMSEIPAFSYDLLWGERIVRSVANLTRCDAEEFLALAAAIPIRSQVRTYALEQANEALDDLRQGHIEGTGVLVIE